MRPALRISGPIVFSGRPDDPRRAANRRGFLDFVAHHRATARGDDHGARCHGPTVARDGTVV
jgi:hypothetical protein